MIRTFRRILPFALGCCTAAFASAQYTTPNTGQTYTLADLVAVSGGVITATTDTSFLQTADLVISVNDTLWINEDITWALADSASIAVFGTFIAAPPIGAEITAENPALHHQGIRFESGSSIDLQLLSITDGGGIKCLTGNMQMAFCTISGQVSNATTGAALELGNGVVYIDNVQFIANADAGISSAANGHAAPRITNCIFAQNGLNNANRPQINLGPSGTDTTMILNNTVVGDPAHTMVGGIAFSSLVGGEGHAVIDSNIVAGNRYGITVAGGNITTRVTNNNLTANNTQGDPMLGGSGLNINGTASNVCMVSGNQITGNLWGITIQGAATVNLGDTAAANFNPGGNAFADNVNNGVTYALYNNTPNNVPAMNNCWDLTATVVDSAAAAAVITDHADQGSLGQVFFVPFSDCGITSSVASVQADRSPLSVFPNPAHSQVTITCAVPMDAYQLFNANGQLVRSQQGPVQGPWSLDGLRGGLYLLKATARNGAVYTQQVVVE
jgi:hypothetical protein